MIRWTGEAEPGHPYWWDGWEKPDLTAPPPATCDLLIIGGGYTGLSAAIAAHDAGANVAVIDKGHPGEGASTRNGGMVGAHPRLPWKALARDIGNEAADAIYAEAAPALQFVRDLVAREGIECDWQDTGRIQLAWTAEHFANQRRLSANVEDKSGVACRVVERDGLGSEIDTSLYKGGILFPDHAAVHPRKYHDGLLAAALRRGIPVLSHCPALRLDRVRRGYEVRTLTALLKADKVLLATNGYTPPFLKWFARRVFPLPSYLIATEPLSPNLIGKLAPGRRMMVETRARHSYFRISPDGTRILFGGRASMTNVRPETAARRLHVTMAEIWPDLADTRVSHVWTGNTGYSFGHMPHVGERSGLHYAVGFSGSGTVLAPYLGAKAAWQALGDPRGDTAYSRTRLGTRWFYRGGAPHFLRAADVWYRHAVDPREDRAARS